MRFRFPKSEKLPAGSISDRLFRPGNRSLTSGPFRFTWLIISNPQPANCQVLIAVSKKNFKTAVARNRIRRQVRELYRLEKQPLARVLEAKELSIALLVSYRSTSGLPYKELQPAFASGIKRISDELERMGPKAVSAADKGL